MAELLKSVDAWFLMLAIVILGGWFVWSIQRIFNNLTASINDLGDLIKNLFKKNDNHERRLSALEGRCDVMHGQVKRTVTDDAA